MELHSHHHKARYYTGQPPAGHKMDAATLQGVEIALQRAEAAMSAGRLLSPGEALALAGPEARHDETLYSIARSVAWETGGDLDIILYELGNKFPTLS